jgi:hypothetical protein
VGRRLASKTILTEDREVEIVVSRDRASRNAFGVHAELFASGTSLWYDSIILAPAAPCGARAVRAKN